MTLADEFRGNDEDDDPRIAKLEETTIKTRRERDAARRAQRAAVARADVAENKLELIEAALATPIKPAPKWTKPRGKAKRGSEAIVCTLLSDAHFDEVVNPDEVNGMNAYDRRIATLRLRRFFDKVASLPTQYLNGPSYKGVVVFMGGDMLSGDIHDELAQTNESTPMGTCLYWSEQIGAGLRMLSEVYPKVHVVSVCGNHGRRTPRERMKMRAIDNFDFLMAQLSQRTVQDIGNVTWDIPAEADARLDVYSTRYLLTHGNLGFGGGGGVAGLMPAIARGWQKRQQRDAATDPFDVLLCGHWHQLKWGGQFIVNGSLKGMDEYAYMQSFGAEPPQQALWVVTPEHGPSWHMPIMVCDRQAEGW